MSVPDAAGGAKYREAMLRMGRKFAWQPDPRRGHTDDEAVGQTYLDLYFTMHDPAMLTPIRTAMDEVMRLREQREAVVVVV